MYGLAAGLRGFSTIIESAQINQITMELARRDYVQQHGEPVTEEQRREVIGKALSAELMHECGQRHEPSELDRLIGVYTEPGRTYLVAVPNENDGGSHYISREGDLCVELEDKYQHLSYERLVEEVDTLTQKIARTKQEEAKFLETMSYAMKVATNPRNRNRSAIVQHLLKD